MGIPRSEAFPSKFFRADDSDLPSRLTIAGASLESLGQGTDAKNRLVLSFRQDDRRFAVNATNWDTIAEEFGDDTDLWMGKTIELYRDKTTYKGERVACIRVHAVKAATAKARPVETDELPPDDL